MELITVGERKDSLSKLAYTIDPNMGDYLQGLSYRSMNQHCDH
jgi:hypothetical protein